MLWAAPSASIARPKTHIPLPYVVKGELTKNGAAFVAQEVLHGKVLSYSWGSTIGNTSGCDKWRAERDRTNKMTGKIINENSTRSFGYDAPPGSEAVSADEFASFLCSNWYVSMMKDEVMKTFLQDYTLPGAARLGRVQTVRALLEAGDHPNQENLLVQLCWGGDGWPGGDEQLEIASALLDAGARVDQVNMGMRQDPHTPLMNAAYKHNAELVEVLVSRGADISFRCACHRKTALDWANAAGGRMPEAMVASLSVPREKAGASSAAAPAGSAAAPAGSSAAPAGSSAAAAPAGRKRTKAEKETRLRAAFCQFDVDNSGTLSVDEFFALLTRPGPEGNSSLTREDAQAILEMCDTNGDGMYLRGSHSSAGQATTRSAGQATALTLLSSIRC